MVMMMMVVLGTWCVQFFEELASEAPEKPAEPEVKDTQRKQVSGRTRPRPIRRWLEAGPGLHASTQCLPSPVVCLRLTWFSSAPEKEEEPSESQRRR